MWGRDVAIGFSSMFAVRPANADPSEKLCRIREIIAAGFAVNHVIHRHGMDDATAIEVEAVLIDAYPGLTNVVAGAGSNDFGAMHADEIIRRYEAEEVVVQHRVIFINVNRSVDRASLYDATRYAWKLSVKRAMRAELVLAVCHGIVIEAFVPETWLPATTENFPGRETVPERFGFIGKVADDSLRAVYVQKRTPDELRKPGAANPIRYTY